MLDRDSALSSQNIKGNDSVILGKIEGQFKESHESDFLFEGLLILSYLGVLSLWLVDEFLELNDISLVENFKKVIDPGILGIFQSKKHGLLKKLWKIVDFFGEKTGHGHFSKHLKFFTLIDLFNGSISDELQGWSIEKLVLSLAHVVGHGESIESGVDQGIDVLSLL